MLLNAHDLATSAVHTDLCIVGTGPAGLTIARHFRADREVWVLEAGRSEDDESSQALYRGRNVGLPYFDLDACRTRRFGGSASCWGGYCRPFEEVDFEYRSRIPNSGWPLTLAEMWPFYARAHTVCGLGPLNYDYAFWARLTGQGRSPFTGPNVTPEVRQKSRFDIEATKRELAASETVHVCLDATVTELVAHEAGGAVTSAVFRDRAGRTRTIHAKRFVLATGGIENARLLLASRRAHDHGIGTTAIWSAASSWITST